jgi:hypothetical protein
VKLGNWFSSLSPSLRPVSNRNAISRDTESKPMFWGPMHINWAAAAGRAVLNCLLKPATTAQAAGQIGAGLLES